MLYEVINITVKTVAAGKTNAGKKYLTLRVQDPDDFEDIQDINQFDENVVNAYLEFIPKSKGGLAEEGTVLPDKMKKLPLCNWEIYTFPELMVRVDEHGVPAKTKTGDYQYRSSVRVLTRNKRDNEKGTEFPRRGWDLESRGSSIMRAFYMPLRYFEGGQETKAVIDTVEQQTQQGAQAPSLTV